MASGVRLGVLGWPVAHSRSPAMQNAALAAAGLHDWRYQLLPVPPELFAETVRALPRLGFVGANVTIPHKAAALALADHASARAQAIGAANTLRFDPNGRIWADNTDAPGMIAALAARGIALNGATVQVLGAGGTARAAVWGLCDAGASVAVWNRTEIRAELLCRELGGHVVSEPGSAEILVQTTSAGLAADARLPDVAVLGEGPDGLGSFTAVVDFVYRAGETPLVEAARRAGVAVIDGLELLVRQGGLAFEIFTGQPAPVDVMEATVRA